MNRTLGEGKVRVQSKELAIIYDTKRDIGNVLFPLKAAGRRNFRDMRECYMENEEVIFTAQRLNSPKHHCSYEATSVIKRKELIKCNGRITEVHDKFCYCETTKGRVFVPYSARNAADKTWLGHGAQKDKTCVLKIFKQPEINGCHWVAFGCELSDGGRSAEDLTTRKNGIMAANEKTDVVSTTQIGCIVKFSSCGDCFVHSAQTGLARLPKDKVQDWMKQGVWIEYQTIEEEYQEQSSGQNPLVAYWAVSNPVDLGMLYEVVEDPATMYEQKLQLRVQCVMNLVLDDKRQAWMWNDYIGRIYVPSHCFRPVDCFSGVTAEIVYTRAYEDVQWSAVKITLEDNDEEIRKRNAQLLLTDNDWTISFLNDCGTKNSKNGQPNNPYTGFLLHPTYGCAFFAWNDFNNTYDGVPKKDQKCRATVFKQNRKKKHMWRAVLVAPLDAEGKPSFHYPMFTDHTGIARPPRPFRSPVTVQPPPALAKAATNGIRIPPASPVQRPVPAQVMPSPPLPRSPSAVSSAVQSRNGSVHQSPARAPAAPPAVAAIGSERPNGRSSNTTELNGNSNGHSAALLSNTTSSSSTPDIGHPAGDLFQMIASNDHLPLLGGNLGRNIHSALMPEEFYPWMPHAHAPSPMTTADTLSEQSMSPPVSKTDQSTQTDVISEQRVLRDIVKNQELLLKVFEAFPAHVEAILEMKWQTTFG